MSGEVLASSWKKFRGRGILNHTPVLCGTISWVNISWFASQARKPRNFYPPKTTPYTVYIDSAAVEATGRGSLRLAPTTSGMLSIVGERERARCLMWMIVLYGHYIRVHG